MSKTDRVRACCKQAAAWEAAIGDAKPVQKQQSETEARWPMPQKHGRHYPRVKQCEECVVTSSSTIGPSCLTAAVSSSMSIRIRLFVVSSSTFDAASDT